MQFENKNKAEQWEDCPQGEVGRLVDSLRQQKRQRRVIQGTVSVGVVVMLLAIGFMLSQFLLQRNDPLLQGNGSPYAGICCEKVQFYEKEYLAKTVDVEIAHKIDGHLKECKHCRTKFEKMQAELLKTTARLLSFDQFALLQ